MLSGRLHIDSQNKQKKNEKHLTFYSKNTTYIDKNSMPG